MTTLVGKYRFLAAWSWQINSAARGRGQQLAAGGRCQEQGCTAPRFTTHSMCKLLFLAGRLDMREAAGFAQAFSMPQPIAPADFSTDKDHLIISNNYRVSLIRVVIITNVSSPPPLACLFILQVS